MMDLPGYGQRMVCPPSLSHIVVSFAIRFLFFDIVDVKNVTFVTIL